MSKAEDTELDELIRAPRVPVGVAILNNSAALRALGIHSPKAQRLGIGNFGQAFQVKFAGRQSVIKLTVDPYEVITSSLLIGKDTKHTVHIYGVWEMQDTRGTDSWMPWYVVHRDILNPLSEKEAILVDALWELYIDEQYDLQFPTPKSHVMRSRWRNLVRDTMPAFTPTMIEQALRLLDAIAAGARELSAVGIDWSDMHSDNIMRDAKGLIRISDIGYNAPREDFKIAPPMLTVEAAKAYTSGLMMAR